MAATRGNSLWPLPSLAARSRPREVEHHIARTIRKLDDQALLRLLVELRNLTAKEGTSNG
ncbi:MAG: hypothetical protein C1943_03805 [Halochromatium sp.]|nr:hypothetical protein [Halochromatium sp.]